MSEQDATLLALAEALKLLQAYRTVCERLLSRPARYVKVDDRRRLATLNQAIRQIDLKAR